MSSTESPPLLRMTQDMRGLSRGIPSYATPIFTSFTTNESTPLDVSITTPTLSPVWTYSPFLFLIHIFCSCNCGEIQSTMSNTNNLSGTHKKVTTVILIYVRKRKPTQIPLPPFSFDFSTSFLHDEISLNAHKRIRATVIWILVSFLPMK